MIEGKASLVIDLGNSETRVKTIFGKTETGEPVSRLSIIPNKFGRLAEDKLRLLGLGDYSPSNSKVLVVDAGYNVGPHDNQPTPAELEETSIFCTGEMCDREIGTSSLTPSSSIKKYDAGISMLSIRAALLEGIYHIADITKSTIDSVNVDWSVSVLLPPSDIDLGKDVIKHKIYNIKHIKFLMPDIEKEIRIENVEVYPEGFCAFMGAIFETKRRIRPGSDKILPSATLVIDIGAGTTDLCIIKGGRLIDGSRHSEDVGGNQVFQNLGQALRRDLGKSLSRDTLIEASITGIARIGSRDINVVSHLKNARQVVSTNIVSAIRNYIESSDYSVFDIENILICGGGAEEYCENSERLGLATLGQLVRKELAELMSYSTFLERPSISKQVIVDGVEYMKEEKISSRLLNIIGAGVIAEK